MISNEDICKNSSDEPFVKIVYCTDMYNKRIFFLKVLFCWSAFALFTSVHLVSGQTSQQPGGETEATRAYIEGVTLFENEEYEEALEVLTFAHMKLPEEPGVNFALADAYLAAGDLTNASYYGKIAVDMDPENKWYHLKLAEIYKEAGRNEATVEAFRRALDYHPEDSDLMFQLAETYVDFGQLLDANAIYDELMKQRGADFSIHLRKFRNFNALQMRDSALVELEEMREIDPGNLTTLRTISQYYLELGEEERALDVLNEARERNSRDPQTLLLLAEIYSSQQQWERMGEVFVSMLKDPLIYPSQKLELVRFIYSEFQNNPNEEQLVQQTDDVLEAFSNNEPDYGPAQLLAAEFYMQKGQNEAALEKLEKTNHLMPEQSDAWRQRMQLLFQMEQYEDVISIADSADTNAPDDAYIQFFAGASYMLSDQPDKAREWLENATYAPANRNFRSVIHSTLADVLSDLDKWDDARQSYERALRLDPNNHNAMNNYAYYLSEKEEELEYAEELAENAVSLQPENAAYLDTIGWVYFKLEEYENAREYIERSVNTGEAGPEVFEHLGDVNEALGDFDEAIKWWNKALENDSNREYLKDRIESVQS